MRVVFVVLAALAVGGGIGCERSAPIAVRRVLVDVEPGAEREIEREAVRELARAMIARDRGFTYDEEAKDGAIARVQVFIATRGDGPAAIDDTEAATPGARPAMVSLGVEVTGGPAAGSRISLRGSGVAHGQGGQDTSPLVGDALQEAFAAIASARVSEREESAVLIARVDDASRARSEREHAIRVLGGRREGAAVAPLVEVLKSEDEVLAPAALHALGQIGEASALDAIFEYASAKPPSVRKVAIDAVRAIGTTRGRAWLFTLSTGHPDPEVQLAATTALAVLDERTVADVPTTDTRVR